MGEALLIRKIAKEKACAHSPQISPSISPELRKSPPMGWEMRESLHIVQLPPPAFPS